MAAIYALLLACWFWKVSGHQPATFIEFAHAHYHLVDSASIPLFNVNYPTRPVAYSDSDVPLNEGPLSYFTVPNYKSLNPTSSPGLVTLCGQLTLDRLQVIPEVAQNWMLSMSIAVYVAENDDFSHVEGNITAVMKVLETRHQRIDFHLLFAYQYAKTHVLIHPYDSSYPINALRNLAIMGASSEFVFTVDIDFIPSMKLARVFKHCNIHKLRQPKTIYVIPAFEYIGDDYDAVPKLWTKELLLHYCIEGKLIPFHSVRLKKEPLDKKLTELYCTGKLNEAYHVRETGVQAATNFSHWFRRTWAHRGNELETYTVDPSMFPYDENLRAQVDRFFEPYFVARKVDLVPFDARFRGYSFNKRQQFTELQAFGFKIEIVVGEFLVHRPHERSEYSRRYKVTDDAFSVEVKNLYRGYLQELYYRMTTNLPLYVEWPQLYAFEQAPEEEESWFEHLWHIILGFQ